ncbi:DUF2824 family protein, partial [Escherichia coli]|uniref:DUF2824 family protein n=1 Tax=Escherichia coli TaxID=562 RepID=UPI00207B1E6E
FFFFLHFCLYICFFFLWRRRPPRFTLVSSVAESDVNKKQFLNSITMVPDTTKYGRAIIRLLGATRVGHLDDAYMSNGKPVGITLYQLPRSKYEELLNVST